MSLYIYLYSSAEQDKIDKAKLEMKQCISYRQTFLHSITSKYHIIDIHCIDFIKKKSTFDWHFMENKVGNVAFDDSKDKETDFKYSERK